MLALRAIIWLYSYNYPLPRHPLLPLLFWVKLERTQGRLTGAADTVRLAVSWEVNGERGEKRRGYSAVEPWDGNGEWMKVFVWKEQRKGTSQWVLSWPEDDRVFFSLYPPWNFSLRQFNKEVFILTVNDSEKFEMIEFDIISLDLARQCQPGCVRRQYTSKIILLGS